MCVSACACVVCVCNGNTSPINSLKAEDKLEITHWKVTKIREIFLILRSSDANFTLKCFFFFKYSNSKFTAFFLQKIQKIKILIFYLIADNQLKRGTIYKKKLRSGRVLMNGKLIMNCQIKQGWFYSELQRNYRQVWLNNYRK